MREKAESQGRDLLVVDTGDRVEGNGLYDSSEPKGIYLSDVLKQQHIDLICSGNHELYKKNTSEAEFLTTVPNFRGNYLASNIDIRDPKTKELVPLAPRFKKFTTKNQGIRIIAFGFLFDFTGNYNNTIVQPVEKTVKDAWFQEAIREKDVDLFVVIGHVPVQSKEYNTIFKEIRSIRWDTPIQFFGGHWHIRDYVRYDAKAYGLASGRFMETVGFMSIDGLRTGGQTDQAVSSTPTFNRMYLDNNLFSFYHHTGHNESTFPTEHGKDVSRLIQDARHALRLDHVHGCAPKDLWMSRTPYGSEDSIYTWLENQVLPDSLRDESRGKKSALAIVNTGAIRFDIFKGPFTQDTTFIVSPFTSGFRYVKDVPVVTARRIVEVMNKQPQILAGSSSNSYSSLSLAPPEQMGRSLDIVSDSDLGPHHEPRVMQNQIFLSGEDGPNLKLTPGYTTVDQVGRDGDDTIHSPVSFYRVPNCIQALIHGVESSPSGDLFYQNTTDPDTVDLVYVDFIEPYVALAAKFSGLDVDFEKDIDVYMKGTSLTNLILDWVKEHWKCDDGHDVNANS
jgi:2',3'-cyclic-nucleotide 2'-phosphodiesterase (5'-nucleotidase family)